MKLALCILAATAALAATSASAAVVYNQPWDGASNFYASQNDTASFGNFATMYDNFKLGSADHITTVDWTGGYFNPPSQGAITKWTLSIYGDNSGQPGGLLYSTSVNGAGNETSLGNVGGFPVFDYSMATNFNAAAGTTYWLSVVPDLGFPPQWGWASGTGGDGVSYQDFFGSRSQVASDLAFSLSVPEPATWAVLLLGLFATGAMLRSRRASEALA